MAATSMYPQHLDYQQHPYSPTFDSSSFSPSDLAASTWNGGASYSPPPAMSVHLDHPVYSQHHAGLGDVVDSARWTSDFLSLGHYEQQPTTSGGSRVAGAVDLALQQSPTATVGDILNNLPVHSLQLSPSSVQRRLSFEDDQDAGQSTKLSPFPAQLLELLDNPQEYADCLCWDSTGTSLIVCNASVRLLQEVLPRFFKHSNIHSFTRQLNVYGFKRMSQPELIEKLDTAATTDYSGWTHHNFLQFDRSLIHTINPKPSRARMQKKLEKQARIDREEKERRAAIYGHNALQRVGGRSTGGRGGSGSSASSGGSMGDWSYAARG